MLDVLAANGDTVVFLDLNLTGTATQALVTTMRRGYRTVLMVRDPAEYRRLDPDPLHLATRVVQVDTFDIAAVLRECQLIRPVALVAFDDYRLLPAAVVRGLLGLAGPDARGIAGARFKDETRRRTAGIGRTVTHVLVDPQHPPRTSPVGYPCIVKPVDDSASAGVRLCADDRQYLAAIRGAVDHATHARGYRCADHVMVEEFVDGPEYSVELLWNTVADSWELVGITQTFISPPPWRRETGHLFPAPLDVETALQIKHAVLRWLGAIGLRYGAAHVELRLDAGVPALLEVNPRPAGGHIPTLVDLCADVDLITGYLDLHLPGGSTKSPAPPQPLREAALRFVMPGRSGLLRRLSVRQADNLPAGQSVDLDTAMLGRQVGPTSRLGHAIATGPRGSGTWATACRLHDLVEFDIATDGKPP